MYTATTTTAANATSRVTTRTGTDTSHHLASRGAHYAHGSGRPRLSPGPGRMPVTDPIFFAARCYRQQSGHCMTKLSSSAEPQQVPSPCGVAIINYEYVASYT